MCNHAVEVEQGERFSFGANWQRFLSVLNDERIEEGKSSLKRMLHLERLEGASLVKPEGQLFITIYNKQ